MYSQVTVLYNHVCFYLTGRKHCRINRALTHPFGWRTADRFSRLSRALLGVRMQLGEGGVEAGDLGEEGTCAALEEVRVGAGSLGLSAKLHYVVLVVVHPVDNQKLSGLTGWVGPGQEAGGESWSTVKERGLVEKIYHI